MLSEEIAERRLSPMVKAGLLCAVLLLPAPLWADTVTGETPTNEPTQVAMATEPSAMVPVITPSTADEKTDSTATNTDQQQTTKLSPADEKTDSTATNTVQQNKLSSLSRHIQERYGIPEQKATTIVRHAMDTGTQNQLDPELILAIIAVESTFRERAVSRVGARGLMQVMPGPHREKVREIGGVRALFDPAKNIHTGSRILTTYLNNHSGNLRRALLNYNGSLGTRSSYADKVMQIYRDFQHVTTPG